MTLNIRAIIGRFGVPILLLACAPWTAKPAFANAGAAADLTQVRVLAEKGSIRDEIALAATLLCRNRRKPGLEDGSLLV